MTNDELALTLRNFDQDHRFHLFEIEGYRVLFRIDGLILTLSGTAFEMMEGLRGIPLEERLRLLRARYGDEEVDSALASLTSLASEGLLTEELPELTPVEAATREPGGILLMITQTCNLACTYCYAGGGTYGARTKLLSQDRAEEAIELMIARAPNRDTFSVTFFGGEPLLNFPMIQRVVEYCRRRRDATGKSFSYSITTNATIMTDEIIEFMKAHGFTVMVSYDGQEAHRTNRPFAGGRDSESVVSDNIARMTASGLPVQLRATLTKTMVSSKTISDLVQIGNSLGVRKVTLSPVSTTKNAIFPAHEDLTLDAADHRQLRDHYQQATLETVEQACAGSEEPVRFDPHLHVTQALARGEAVGMGRCGAGLGMSAVSTDGAIYPCHRFVGMAGYEIGSLEEGVNSDRVQQFFDKAHSAAWPKCSTCWVRLMCTGGCYYHNADGDGGFVAPEDSACEEYRESVKFSVGQVLRVRSLPPLDAKRYFQNTSGQ